MYTYCTVSHTNTCVYHTCVHCTLSILIYVNLIVIHAIHFKVDSMYDYFVNDNITINVTIV